MRLRSGSRMGIGFPRKEPRAPSPKGNGEQRGEEIGATIAKRVEFSLDSVPA
jgi:hypothetical protein